MITKRMAPGKYAYDPFLRRFRYFVGYCDHCNEKVFLDNRDAMAVFRTVVGGEPHKVPNIYRTIAKFIPEDSTAKLLMGYQKNYEFKNGALDKPKVGEYTRDKSQDINNSDDLHRHGE